jgi:cell wall-associated NlpC family hydrolase
VNFDRFVGIPYLDKGRTAAGLDCWGLVQLVFQELRGVELPSYVDRYVTAADRKAISALIAGEIDPWRPIEKGQESMFDGVLIREGRIPRHIGLVTEPGRLLHVDVDQTSRIEPYRHGILASRVVGFYRFTLAR